MPPRFSVAGAILTGLILVWLVTGIVRGPRLFQRLLAARERRDPTALSRFYRRLLLGTWLVVAVGLLALVVSPGVDPAQVGLALPSGPYGLAATGLSALFVLAVAVGRLRAARRAADRAARRAADGPPDPAAVGAPDPAAVGVPDPAADRAVAPVPPSRTAVAVAALLPRTRSERRLAAGVAVTAGIGEEFLFRGLLIAAGVGIAGLSWEGSALLVLLLFVLGHLYQGPGAILGVALVGTVLTGLYLISGSLLLPILLHTVLDLASLLAPPRALRELAGEAI